jgi:alanyl-tRNA synthetase
MFFQYFMDCGHTLVQSSSTIPYDDPTLLFMNVDALSLITKADIRNESIQTYIS